MDVSAVVVWLLPLAMSFGLMITFVKLWGGGGGGSQKEGPWVQLGLLMINGSLAVVIRDDIGLALKKQLHFVVVPSTWAEASPVGKGVWSNSLRLVPLCLGGVSHISFVLQSKKTSQGVI